MLDRESGPQGWIIATHSDHISDAKITKVVNTEGIEGTARNIFFDNGYVVGTENHQYPEKTDPMLHFDVVRALDSHKRRERT